MTSPPASASAPPTPPPTPPTPTPTPRPTATPPSGPRPGPEAAPERRPSWASSTVERAERWIDLDAEPPPPPVRRQSARLAVIAAAVVGGALAGAALAAAARPELPPAPPPAVAVVSLDTFVLDPVPSAVLTLRVDNLGETRQVVREVRVSGGGAADLLLPIVQEIPVGGGVDVRVVVALNCGTSPAADSGRVSATLRVTAANGTNGTNGTDGTDGTDGTRPSAVRPDVLAVSSGRAARLGGLCAGADTVLPGGWRTPVRVTGRGVEGGELDLTVDGLPADASRVAWIEADGVLLPQPRLDPTVRSGSAHLRVPPPTPGCRDSGLRPVVPTGVQLRLATPDGLRSVYAPVGAVVAQWLMDAYVRACPASPAGPAVMQLALLAEG